jgi:hypothetical protein
MAENLIIKNVSIVELIYLLSFIKLKTGTDTVCLNILENGKRILITEYKKEEDKKENNNDDDDEKGGFELNTMDDLDKLL